MAGYSGTPLAKKLGIKPDMKVYFHALPTDVKKELKAALTDANVTDQLKSDLDFIHGFVSSHAELKKSLPKWKKGLSKSGSLWISWPKKTSDLKTDLSGDIVRETGLDIGLVDIKVCAVDETWSGLKFVYRKADR